ncbi:hypothetical protein P8452_74574 [Trifolium repens]|nr:hypothetical protein P8452_74574 [Trifolium repens]
MEKEEERFTVYFSIFYFVKPEGFKISWLKTQTLELIKWIHIELKMVYLFYPNSLLLQFCKHCSFNYYASDYEIGRCKKGSCNCCRPYWYNFYYLTYH